MLLERLTDALELVVRLRHLLLQLGHRLRRAHTGDDVLALRVDEELAVELLGAVGRVARERNTRARPLTGVAVDHRLHVDGSAPLGRDVVLAAIHDRAVVHPRSEDRADGAHELIPRRHGELLADALFHERLETAHEFLEVVHRQRGVFDVLVMTFALQRLDHRFKRLVVFGRQLLHAQNDIAVHLHEAAVAVPRETRVAGLRREGFDRLIVQAEVQDRVHHARHRIARTRAHGDEQRVLEVTELLAGLSFDHGEARLHLGEQRGRVGALVVVVVGADVGRDRETRGHRQTDAAHLGEVRALATEQRLHLSVAVSLAATERVHVLVRLRRRLLRGGLLGGRLLRNLLHDFHNLLHALLSHRLLRSIPTSLSSKVPGPKSRGRRRSKSFVLTCDLPLATCYLPLASR